MFAGRLSIFVQYQLIIHDFSQLMNANRVQVHTAIPLDNRSILTSTENSGKLHKIIDIVEKFKCCTLAIRNLDNPDSFYEL